MRCDGYAHLDKGIRLDGQVVFSCFQCHLDWCGACASSELHPTAGAKVVKVKLQYHLKNLEQEEPTLKLGWKYAISSHGNTAKCGPCQARDHGHVVPISRVHELKSKCEELQFKLDELEAPGKKRMKIEGATPGKFAHPKTPTSILLAQPRASRSCSSPPPLLALADETARANLEVRRQCQERYCTTQVMKSKAEMEAAVKVAQATAKQRVDAAESKELKVREVLSSTRAAHRADMAEIINSLKAAHLRDLQKQKDDLISRHLIELDSLRHTLKQEEFEHRQTRKSLCADHSSQRANLRRQLREAQDEATKRFEEKIALLHRNFDAERASLEADCERKLDMQNDLLSSEVRALQKVINTINRVHVKKERSLQKKVKRLTEKLREASVEAEDYRAQLEGRTADRVGRRSNSDLGIREKYDHVKVALENLCDQLNLRVSHKLPKPVHVDEHRPEDIHGNSLFGRNVSFLAGALTGRSAPAIAAALKRNEQVGSLFQTKAFQPFIKEEVSAVLSRIQNHWGPRHAVILMQEVHTSRSEFDSLRHLLSFQYNRENDVYERKALWKNPFNPHDQLFAPVLAARGPRERERALVFDKCGATSSEDGMVSEVLDVKSAAAYYVEHYWDALDPAVQCGDTPLLMVLTGDATGGWRGEAVTHGELGLGSWAKGKAQSKLT